MGKLLYWRERAGYTEGMKTTIDRIEAGKILPAAQLAKLGITPRRIVRVVVETVDEDDTDFAAMNDDTLMAAVDDEVAAYRADKNKPCASAK